MSFKFKLGDVVRIRTSGESGEVIGRAEFSTAINNYYLRYQSADGRAIEAWWTEDALEAK